MRYIVIIIAAFLMSFGCGGTETDTAANDNEPAQEETTVADETPTTEQPTDEGTAEEAPEDVAPQVEGSILVIFGQDQDQTFLGILNLDPMDPDSICNGFGTFGNSFNPDCIWNELGEFGSDMSIDSAFNNMTASPPILYEWDGSDLAPLYYITTNTLLSPRIDSWDLLYYLQDSGCSCDR